MTMLDLLAVAAGYFVGSLGNPLLYVLAAVFATRRMAPWRVLAALAWGLFVSAFIMHGGGELSVLLCALVMAAQFWLVSRLIAGLFVLAVHLFERLTARAEEA